MVRIDDDYIVEVDSLCYTAKKELHKTDKEGKQLCKIIGYYSDLCGAIKGIYDYKAKDKLSKDEKSLYEAIKVLDELKNELAAMLERATV